MLDALDPSLQQLDRAVQQQAEQNAEAVRLMTHPGVGPVTSLAFVLTIGPVGRFERSKQVVSYLGLNPREHSSGGTAAIGCDLETRQSHDAFAAGRSRTHGGASGRRTATGLPAAEVAAWQRSSESSDGEKVGGSNVLDAAQPGQLCAAGSHARQPVGHPGEGVIHRRADWAPCLPEKVGEFEQRITIGSKVTG